MLSSLKEIGEILLKVENKEEIDILLENPDSNGTYKTVWVLNFSKDFEFLGVSVEEFKKENWKLYLYKKGPSNGLDYSPTSRVTEYKKTFENKILRWLKENDEPNIKKMYQQLEGKKDDILKTLEELDKQNKGNKILTVKIDGKYPYEIENFKTILLEDYISKLKEVSKRNSLCSICGEIKEEVFTTSNIYKFYTLDKPGYIAGGFREQDAWKNFPICKDCFLKVEYAKKYVEENLKFNFYGKTYYIIPHLILNTKEALEEINDILKHLSGKVTLDKGKNFSSDEKEILMLLKDYKDFVSFYLLFLKKENSAERILLLVEDVLPSRISKIFSAKEDVEKAFNQSYNFGKLNQFLDLYDKLFFEIVERIFKGGLLDFQTLIGIFTRKIREKFLTDYDDKFKYLVLDAVMNLRFLGNLRLLNFGGERMENLDEIYQKLGGALNTPAKKGIFLLGVLTQILLDIQNKERNSSPFIKSLKSLKMNEEDIKGLLPKVINKLMEYNEYKYIQKEIAKEVSKNFLIQDKFKLNVDEINFYFAAGMALKNEVLNILYEKFKVNKEESDGNQK
ncbi:TIGR02556 family CRISPR-associated protein [Sulfurihydrogenibium sp.]|uniref:TIGR02556 family CRISPR-associated protein n=1 Tax=Sulfurihydrogenibium sp. TaxID=2053621 RepID=UPI0026095A66|nr:TIGR02556 family CRISPR-associated protein [Sulfurihydrogenibium sp.]